MRWEWTTARMTLQWINVKVKYLLPLLVDMGREKQSILKIRSTIHNLQADVYMTPTLFSQLSQHQAASLGQSLLAIKKISEKEEEVLAICNMIVDPKLIDRAISAMDDSGKSSRVQLGQENIWMTRDHLTRFNLNVDSIISICAIDPLEHLQQVPRLYLSSPRVLSLDTSTPNDTTSSLLLSVDFDSLLSETPKQWTGASSTTPLHINRGETTINLFLRNGTTYQFNYSLTNHQQKITNDNDTLSTTTTTTIFKDWRILSNRTKLIYQRQLFIEPSSSLTTNESVDKFNSYDEESRLKIRKLLDITFKEDKRREYAYYGLEPPRSLLINGPTGCGKKTLIDGISKEYLLPDQIIYLTMSDLTKYDTYLKGFQQKFNQAKQHLYSVFVIENIDEIFPNLENDDTKSQEESLTGMMMNIMEKNNSQNTFIIAMTSKLRNVSNLVRSLFDEQIKIDPPSIEKRKEIFNYHMKDFGVDYKKENDLVIDEINENCSGFVGGDLVLLCREAQINSLYRLKKEQQKNNNNNNNIDIDIKKILFKKQDFHNEIINTIKVDMTFSKFSPTSPKVSWDDIGGLESVKQSLMEMVVWDYKHHDALERLGVKTPRGILLYGPPGTGKTLLSKAVAYEARASFIVVNISEIVQGEVGESEKMLADIFKRAVQAAPSIVFIDEIQAIFGQRDSSGSHGKNIISQLLIEMDRIGELAAIPGGQRVMVLAATNLPQAIDESFLRPGRFDRSIYVGPPDSQERLKILQNICKSVKLGDDVQLVNVANYTVNYSGSDLNGLIKKAGLAAIARQSTSISKLDIESTFFESSPSITKDMLDMYKCWNQQ
ncbi:putative ATPase [Cavenderia fasciculata]|uniref:ATPase n=1 Tax=Cavenderia fasciculata TaxID=261658 RepID=F4Q4G0_CACFS|nr:putative ATPase [Cavenderia fasciculata]EGG17809.1 putative ATPase [Cavenderia fasciculata]|eukprot:XP_004356293.1 putative ATPase [Cavenderia fasciculata]